MKRPLFTVGFIYLTAMAVAFYVNYVAAIVVIGVLCFAMLMIAGDKSDFGKIALSLLSTGIAALVISVCFTIFKYGAVKSLEGMNIPIEGTITSEEHYDRIHNYEVLVNLDGMPILGSNNVRIQLTTFERLDAVAGDSISGEFTIWGLHKITNDEMLYLSKGILASATTSKPIEIMNEPINKFLSMFIKFKTELINAVEYNVRNSRGGLVSALLFGDGDRVEDNIRQSFNHSGISHILAISGLHLAIVIHIVAGFVKKFFGEKKSAIVAIIAVWAFVLLGGAGYSLIRSGIMFTIYYIGVLIDRDSDGLNSLGIAAILITTINPYSIANLSMQLSFLATFGILTIAPVLEKAMIKYVLNDKMRKSTIIRSIVKVFMITIAAQIPVAPIVTLKFGFLSLISPITNILISPIIPIVIFLGLATAFLGVFELVSIASICGNITTFMIEVIINISDFLSSVPFASLYIEKSYIGIWFFFVIICAVWIYKTKCTITKPIGYLIIASVFTLLIGATTEKAFELNTVKLINIEGSTSITLIKNNRAVIIGMPEDRKTAMRVIDTINKNSVDGIDLLIISDTGEVLTSGADYLFDTKEVEYIVSPEDEYTDDYLSMMSDAKIFPLKNMEIIMLDGIQALVSPYWGVEIMIRDISILKLFDDYDIMKSRNTDSAVIIDATGIPYIKDRNAGIKYTINFDGSGEFMLR